MPSRLSDLTAPINLLREKGTGPVRTMRPTYVDLLPPCNAACPAGENIQAWLDLAQAGQYRQAWEAILADNPFPAVHGRVCYHPCETGCNRAELDSAVSIHAVERFLGDLAVTNRWRPPPSAASTGKRILVVGAGPSGLSAAYHLARLGHAVEVRDAGASPGGMLQFGIPTYRLPRAELKAEIGRIEAMGVKIILNHKVEDLVAEQVEGRFDAVFLGIGADIAKRIDIPTRDAARVLDAVTLLHDVGSGQAPKLGRRVIVYGLGDTAIDAARTARRLGAEDPLIVFFGDRALMSAHPADVEDALAEGVKIKWLSTITNIAEGALTVEIMRLDSAGQPQPTGEFEHLAADSVVLAIGQDTESAFLKGVPGLVFAEQGTVAVDSAMMTGRAGVFAGGDMTRGDRTVTAAVGRGKAAARHMHAWLRGAAVEVHAKHPVIDFGRLNLPIYADAAAAPQRQLEAAVRVGGFEEIMSGLSEPQARHEAKRCLSCGNCFECDQCYAACPVDAIIKLGPGKRYAFDFDRCTGCGICFEQCPCHAIDMTSEPSAAPQETRT